MDGPAEDLHDPAARPTASGDPLAPTGLLRAGRYSERTGYAVVRPHGSGDWLLTYTVAGAGRYRQPGPPAVDLLTEPGDLVLLAIGAVHDYSVPAGGSWGFSWVHVQPRPGWLVWWRPPAVGNGLFRVQVRTPAIRDRIARVFAEVVGDAQPTGLATRQGRIDPTAAFLRRELAVNGVEQILLLAAAEQERATGRPLDERVRRVFDLMAADLAAPHDVDTLARAVSLSPSRLAHLFKEDVGEAIGGTLLSLRLQEAARLLESSGRSVAEVAAAVGFASPFYFSRQFRRRYGVSPRAYRRAAGRVAPPRAPERS